MQLHSQPPVPASEPAPAAAQEVPIPEEHQVLRTARNHSTSTHAANPTRLIPPVYYVIKRFPDLLKFNWFNLNCSIFCGTCKHRA